MQIAEELTVTAFIAGLGVKALNRPVLRRGSGVVVERLDLPGLQKLVVDAAVVKLRVVVGAQVFTHPVKCCACVYYPYDIDGLIRPYRSAVMRGCS